MSTRLIIADPHPVTLVGLRCALEATGADVVAEARSIEDLLDVLQRYGKSAPTLIVDPQLPGCNKPSDLAFVQNVRMLYPALPVIVFTAERRAQVFAQLVGAGVLGIVEKCADLTALAAALQAVSAGKLFVSASAQSRLAEDKKRKRSTHRSPVFTNSESDVMDLLANGLKVSEIGRARGKSTKTISSQKLSAMRKIGVTTDSELYAWLRDRNA